MNTTGTIHYGRSYITLLEEELNAFTKFSGLIDSKVEGNNGRLKDLVKNKKPLSKKYQVCTHDIEHNILTWKVQ